MQHDTTFSIFSSDVNQVPKKSVYVSSFLDKKLVAVYFPHAMHINMYLYMTEIAQ